ncbi:MAG TPA: nuclear transport factor 2 family protein [Nitrospira sp.]|nr:nuclear transport factor 2 family protein [Nitrospira sp.]
MSANNPQEICRLFQRYMAKGDLDLVLSLYDEEAVFAKQTGEVTKGREALKAELTPLAAGKPRFDYTVKQVIETGEIALMHTEWNVSETDPITVYAIEVACRQPDGTWRWLIGDPYTVGRNMSVSRKGR